jgi:tRNA-guanine family transglycosylase
MLASTLISIHNIAFLINLMNEVRQSIINQKFDTFAEDFLRLYKPRHKQETQ